GAGDSSTGSDCSVGICSFDQTSSLCHERHRRRSCGTTLEGVFSAATKIIEAKVGGSEVALSQTQNRHAVTGRNFTMDKATYLRKGSIAAAIAVMGATLLGGCATRTTVVPAASPPTGTTTVVVTSPAGMQRVVNYPTGRYELYGD